MLRISVWAIAIGLVIMIIAVATGNGLRKEIRNKITGFGGNIQIINYQPNPTYEQTPVELGDSLISEISNRAEVSRIQAFSRKAGIMKTENDFEGVILKGVGSNYNWQSLDDYLVAGHFLHLNDSTYNDSILISESIASRLGLNLNDRVSVYFVRDASRPPLLRRFYLAGIFKTDLEEVDNSIILGDIRHVQRLNQWEGNQVGGYEVFLNDPENAQAIANEIRLFIPYTAEALTARQMNEQLFQWLDLFDINILLIIIIMIVVATINMSIALLILILERTQMIGILKALGTTNRSIQQIFLINATYLIGKGLLWGNILGIGLCLLQQKFEFIKLDPGTYYVSAVSIDLNPFYIIGLNVITIVICVACLIIPSFLITRISPVKAIRFD